MSENKIRAEVYESRGGKWCCNLYSYSIIIPLPCDTKQEAEAICNRINTDPEQMKQEILLLKNERKQLLQDNETIKRNERERILAKIDEMIKQYKIYRKDTQDQNYTVLCSGGIETLEQLKSYLNGEGK